MPLKSDFFFFSCHSIGMCFDLVVVKIVFYYEDVLIIGFVFSDVLEGTNKYTSILYDNMNELKCL